MASEPNTRRQWLWIVMIVLAVLLIILVIAGVRNNSKEEPSTTTSTTALTVTEIEATAPVKPTLDQLVTAYKATAYSSEIDKEYVVLKRGPGQPSTHPSYATVTDEDGNEVRIPNGADVTVKSEKVEGYVYVVWHDYEGWADSHYIVT